MTIQVSNPPDKPLMIYDGDCHFCTRWIMRWKKMTGLAIEYITSQELGGRFSEIPTSKFSDAVCLVTPKGEAIFGAPAVYFSLSLGGVRLFQFVYKLYRNFFLFRWLSDLSYQAVAKHRMFFSSLEKRLAGEDVSTVEFHRTASYFRVFVALIFLAAFWSAGSQLLGLVGSSGIYPTEQVVEQLTSRYSAIDRFLKFPSLTLLHSTDTILIMHCIVGSLIALMVAFGVMQSIGFLVLWLLYLSLSIAGSVFFSFQWDTLIVECAFLLIFISPNRLKMGLHSDYHPPRFGVWLFRWLLFRLVFASGYLKIASADAEWTQLTAMKFHYFTQPLPSVIAWFFHQLPDWFHRTSTVIVLLVETVLPVMLFCGRRAERFALVGIACLMGLIMITGSYCFFNLLTLSICFLLWGTNKIAIESKGCSIQSAPGRKSKRSAMDYYRLTVFTIIFICSSIMFFHQMKWFQTIIDPAYRKISFIRSFRTLNTYGLFVNMTTDRDEIVIEGSDNLREWKEYEFRYKPGDLSRMPFWNIPHQPRIDWQMWFAGLGSINNNRWVGSLLNRLLNNESTVTDLLMVNPFEDGGPRFIRAVRYSYYFSEWEDLIQNGVWWRRSRKGAYSSIISNQKDAVALQNSRR